MFKNFKIKGIALKIFIPVTAMVLLLCSAFFIMISNGINNVVLIDQNNNLKAQSKFIMTYLDKMYPGEWSVNGNQLYKGSKQISGNSEIVDLVNNRTGYYCTLFLNDIRTSTSVKVNGKRATGTKASSIVVGKVLKGSQDYTGYANVAGMNIISYYTPLKDRSGNVIGMFFLGNEQSAISKVVSGTQSQLILIMVFALIVSIFISLMIAFYLSNKIGDCLEMIKEFSRGQLSRRLKTKSKDEIGEMSHAMNELADTLQFKVLDTMDKISQGNMTSSIESQDADDQITPVLQRTLETVSSIINDTNKIIGAANEGNLSMRIDTSAYRGSWALLLQNINMLMDSVSKPIEEVREVVGKISVNDYTVKIEGGYQGAFKNLGNDVNRVRNNLLLLQDNMSLISKGDISRLDETKKVGKLSENDNMTPAIIAMMQNIERLIAEVKRITAESVNGNVINARGNAEHFQGGFKQIIDGFNVTLDSISNPLLDIMKILNAMAVNDFTSEIENNYKGDYKKLRDAVERVTKALLSAQNAAIKISNGDISELENYRSIGKRSENDKLVPAFTQMMESVQSLIDESTAIADSAANGNLSARGNANKFNGGYAAVVTSINDLLNSIESPVNEVKRVMTAISDCRLDERIHEEYNGEFKVLADAVNATVSMLESMVNKISDIMTKMSAGDFSVEQIEKFNGNFSPISEAMNAILDSLNELLGNINLTSEQVASGSSQVAQGSQSLSQGATEQASAVEELTASVTEIAVQTRHNAADANEANKLVAVVKESASSGNSNMNDMLKSMSDIGKASSNISKIIKVIDDIAFQTNILALNAAVEAARAGQYGKGFAVVAEEVRNLAAKSADAAKNTTDLIEGTITKVNIGAEIANKTAKALGDIVDGVNKVTTFVGQISTASNEQSTSIVQIEKGLQQVSQVIQTISATSEESAASSEELTGQAELLKQQVAKFNLREVN